MSRQNRNYKLPVLQKMHWDATSSTSTPLTNSASASGPRCANEQGLSHRPFFDSQYAFISCPLSLQSRLGWKVGPSAGRLALARGRAELAPHMCLRRSAAEKMPRPAIWTQVSKKTSDTMCRCLAHSMCSARIPAMRSRPSEPDRKQYTNEIDASFIHRARSH